MKYSPQLTAQVLQKAGIAKRTGKTLNNSQLRQTIKNTCDTDKSGDFECSPEYTAGRMTLPPGISRKQASPRPMMLPVPVPPVMGVPRRVDKVSGTEQIGIAVSLVTRDGRPRAGSRPDPRQHSLLAGPGLVVPPDLDAFRVRPVGNRLVRKCLEILAECLLAGPVDLGMARTGRYEGITEIPGQKANRLDAVPYAEGIEDAVAKVAEPPPRPSGPRSAGSGASASAASMMECNPQNRLFYTFFVRFRN